MYLSSEQIGRVRIKRLVNNDLVFLKVLFIC